MDLPQATPGLWGCRSWVELEGLTGGVSLGAPALEEGGWQEAQAGLREALEQAGRAGVRVTKVEL